MAFIGIDLGGTQLRVAVADARGRLRTVVRHPTEAARGRLLRRIILRAQDGSGKYGHQNRKGLSIHLRLLKHTSG